MSMGVYIKGMEMPKDGYRTVEITFDADGHPMALADGGDVFDVIPVLPHGRTIDVAALWVEINKICDRRDAGIISDLTCVQQLLSAVRHAPTIIPAEPLNEEVNE